MSWLADYWFKEYYYLIQGKLRNYCVGEVGRRKMQKLGPGSNFWFD